MLSARHQRSLYKRYVNENELIWVVEKNAKDLLPGWAMITPFSSRTRYTLIGKTDIGIAIVTITLIASMISSANFLMTYRYLSTLNNRKMRDARSFFSEALIAASWMMIAANPMLILGLLMLLSDRH
jgi:heme/copper-type cytochrome/quinol oxidase subunit 1